MIQGLTDFEKHVGVDPGLAKDLVKVFSSAVYFASQPGNGATLMRKLVFDALAYVERIGEDDGGSCFRRHKQ